ncbi:DsbA family protein [Kocuria sp. p3-SID1428]|uniref:DsbA family protein n=2 Tax=unclassified Kocuria TaxID=2649579 RepID=UPI0021A60A43|nr:DsbA family protein [Kocuria sp. p3-SID1428]MCT1601468.1 DsbA family protein [Kocuria sp. p3-SID1428]
MASTHDKDDFRAQARGIADKHAQADQRQKRLLQIGIAILVVAILVIAGLVFWQVRSQRIPESGPVPASANQWGGIELTADGITKDSSDTDEVSVDDAGDPPETPPEDPDAEGIVEPGTAAESDEPVQIVIWQDFDCVHCAEFEQTHAEDLAEVVDSGEATVEYRTVNYLDNATYYSSRAAAAYYEVANQVGTDEALAFQQEMFTHQGTGGLDDDEIIEIASKHGADIEQAMDDKDWRPMVDYTSATAQADGVNGTPTAMVDGVVWEQGSSLSEAVKAAAEGKDPNDAADEASGSAADDASQSPSASGSSSASATSSASAAASEG